MNKKELSEILRSNWISAEPLNNYDINDKRMDIATPLHKRALINKLDLLFDDYKLIKHWKSNNTGLHQYLFEEK